MPTLEGIGVGYAQLLASGNGSQHANDQLGAFVRVDHVGHAAVVEDGDEGEKPQSEGQRSLRR